MIRKCPVTFVQVGIGWDKNTRLVKLRVNGEHFCSCHLQILDRKLLLRGQRRGGHRLELVDSIVHDTILRLLLLQKNVLLLLLLLLVLNMVLKRMVLRRRGMLVLSMSCYMTRKKVWKS